MLFLRKTPSKFWWHYRISRFGAKLRPNRGLWTTLDGKGPGCGPTARGPRALGLLHGPALRNPGALDWPGAPEGIPEIPPGQSSPESLLIHRDNLTSKIWNRSIHTKNILISLDTYTVHQLGHYRIGPKLRNGGSSAIKAASLVSINEKKKEKVTTQF